MRQKERRRTEDRSRISTFGSSGSTSLRVMPPTDGPAALSPTRAPTSTINCDGRGLYADPYTIVKAACVIRVPSRPLLRRRSHDIAQAPCCSSPRQRPHKTARAGIGTQSPGGLSTRRRSRAAPIGRQVFSYVERPEARLQARARRPRDPEAQPEVALQAFIVFEPGNHMDYLRDMNLANLARLGSGNHWPVAQILSDGRTSLVADRGNFLGSRDGPRSGVDARGFANFARAKPGRRGGELGRDGRRAQPRRRARGARPRVPLRASAESRAHGPGHLVRDAS